MEICDRAAGSAAGARECLRAVLRRLAHPDPHVQVHAATLLDACVANCGRAFLLEVASRDFEAEYRRLLARAQPPVAQRLRALLRKWAEGEFRSDPQLDLIPSMYAKVRAESGEAPTVQSLAPPPAPALTPAGAAAAAAAVQREQEELARAIALSLKDAAPAPVASSAAPASLYPRVEAAEPPPASPRKVRALYDFEAAEDNELTFFAGETVYVTDASDPNWWKGHNERGEGLFPANFVTSETESAPAGEREAAKGAGGAGGVGGAAGAEEAPPSSIDEAAMDEALALLHEADPTGEAGVGGVGGEAEGEGEARLAQLERRALAMGALVDLALERADRRHARLTLLSKELVEALNLYHSLMREPHAPPPPHAPHPHPHPHPLAHKPQLPFAPHAFAPMPAPSPMPMPMPMPGAMGMGMPMPGAHPPPPQSQSQQQPPRG